MFITVFITVKSKSIARLIFLYCMLLYVEDMRDNGNAAASDAVGELTCNSLCAIAAWRATLQNGRAHVVLREKSENEDTWELDPVVSKPYDKLLALVL